MLIGIALLVGPLLGALLARAVVPLVVLTGEATRPSRTSWSNSPRARSPRCSPGSSPSPSSSSPRSPCAGATRP
ncbi:hypothetical protein ACFQVA_12175 [Actinomadura keratinilytica]